jgi:glycine betaine/proline transport system ATP-binding protein
VNGNKAPTISVKNLYKIFGNKPSKSLDLISQGASRADIVKKTQHLVALRDISFEVKEGEIFVIMGLSGCGKSTLLRCLARLHEPTKGSINIRGKDITDLNSKQLIELRRKIFGMVFQHFALFTHRTVLENVQFGLELQDVERSERKNRSEKVLKQVGLEGWEKEKIDSLSGGMQQRVGLARALAVDPEVLLMDEPFSALDPLIRVKMQEELLRLQNKMNMTTVFVTHDLNEAIRLGDRIAILNPQGELVQVGKPEDILLDPADDYVEEFVQDVDRPSALRMETIMQKISGDKKPESKNTVNLLQPLKDAIPYLMTSDKPVEVIDNNGRLVGKVDHDSVAKILKK